jgi:hypothetical protein
MSSITGHVTMAVLEVFHNLQPFQLLTKTENGASASDHRQRGIGLSCGRTMHVDVLKKLIPMTILGFMDMGQN